MELLLMKAIKSVWRHRATSHQPQYDMRPLRRSCDRCRSLKKDCVRPLTKGDVFLLSACKYCDEVELDCRIATPPASVQDNSEQEDTIGKPRFDVKLSLPSSMEQYNLISLRPSTPFTGVEDLFSEASLKDSQPTARMTVNVESSRALPTAGSSINFAQYLENLPWPKIPSPPITVPETIHPHHRVILKDPFPISAPGIYPTGDPIHVNAVNMKKETKIFDAGFTYQDGKLCRTNHPHATKAAKPGMLHDPNKFYMHWPFSGPNDEIFDPDEPVVRLVPESTASRNIKTVYLVIVKNLHQLLERSSDFSTTLRLKHAMRCAVPQEPGQEGNPIEVMIQNIRAFCGVIFAAKRQAVTGMGGGMQVEWISKLDAGLAMENAFHLDGGAGAEDHEGEYKEKETDIGRSKAHGGNTDVSGQFDSTIYSEGEDDDMLPMFGPAMLDRETTVYLLATHVAVVRTLGFVFKQLVGMLKGEKQANWDENKTYRNVLPEILPVAEGVTPVGQIEMLVGWVQAEMTAIERELGVTVLVKTLGFAEDIDAVLDFGAKEKWITYMITQGKEAAVAEMDAKLRDFLDLWFVEVDDDLAADG